jgi:hypothetical protein
MWTDGMIKHPTVTFAIGEGWNLSHTPFELELEVIVVVFLLGGESAILHTGNADCRSPVYLSNREYAIGIMIETRRRSTV